jgi:hypothetical protein
VAAVDPGSGAPASGEGCRRGAYDCLAKPSEPDEAVLVVQRALERKRLREQARDLPGAARFEKLVAKSPTMIQVLDLMRRVAESDATVLVTIPEEVARRGRAVPRGRGWRAFPTGRCSSWRATGPRATT